VSIVLVLPYPVSANVYWRSRTVPASKGKPAFVQHYVSPEGRAYKEDVAWRAKAAGVRSPLIGRVQFHLELYPHRPQDYAKRMRDAGDAWDNDVRCIDLDNANKVLRDALNGVAYEDDRWIWHDSGIRAEPDAHGARVVVRIESYVRPVPVEQLALLPDAAPLALKPHAELFAGAEDF
jgi:crossover junction endodeoxyribonuclease RusA